MGYDNENAFIGLGTIGLIIVAYFFSLIFLGLLKVYLIITKGKYGGKHFFKFLYKKLIFSVAINIGLEAYTEMLIYGFIAIQSSFQFSILNGEILGYSVGYFAILITILFLPVQLIRITFFTS